MCIFNKINYTHGVFTKFVCAKLLWKTARQQKLNIICTLAPVCIVRVSIVCVVSTLLIRIECYLYNCLAINSTLYSPSTKYQASKNKSEHTTMQLCIPRRSRSIKITSYRDKHEINFRSDCHTDRNKCLVVAKIRALLTNSDKLNAREYTSPYHSYTRDLQFNDWSASEIDFKWPYVFETTPSRAHHRAL